MKGTVGASVNVTTLAGGGGRGGGGLIGRSLAGSVPGSPFKEKMLLLLFEMIRELHLFHICLLMESPD